MKDYIVDYYIDKFEDIPARNWCTHSFIQTTKKGTVQCCTLGHCGMNHSNNPTDEAIGLIEIITGRKFQPNTYDSHDQMNLIYQINDYSDYNKKPGWGPKDRILDRLYSIKGIKRPNAFQRWFKKHFI